MNQTRLEHDLLGERAVPADRYYGIQTLRALENFAMTGIPISAYPRLINSLRSDTLCRLVTAGPTLWPPNS